MGKTYPQIDDKLAAWIQEQQMFFVSTAPLAADGLVNCSPKGGADTFTILDEKTVAYLDFTGSGVETIAHLKENGRIVIMFCAFTGPANIVRLHGKGEVIEPHHPEFQALRTRFPADYPGVRSIIRIGVDRVSDSCGYGVPQYQYIAQRETLQKHAEHLGPEGVRDYQRTKNSQSLDGLPGVAVHP
ncbi:MAG: pyridoxamine 5'-phosphate oxidase family protein [Caldilineaceae bacterium]|nr:pyridoxamine 5'-phosphate oxidase family protein [Caldilineaceae bacterium]